MFPSFITLMHDEYYNLKILFIMGVTLFVCELYNSFPIGGLHYVEFMDKLNLPTRATYLT